jgi:hypothetical protein
VSEFDRIHRPLASQYSIWGTERLARRFAGLLTFRQIFVGLFATADVPDAFQVQRSRRRSDQPQADRLGSFLTLGHVDGDALTNARIKRTSGQLLIRS